MKNSWNTKSFYTNIFSKILKSRGKRAFLLKLPLKSRILDVGCGNNSPFMTKTLRPDCHYTGLDVCEYRQTKTNLADRYLTTPPEKFAEQLEGMPARSFDAVFSSHNLEHCNEPERVLNEMIQLIAPGGRLFLAFPSARTIMLAPRTGTLNYFDDPTHLNLPPDWCTVVSKLQLEGLELQFATESYRPLVLSVIGAALEPVSYFRKTVMLGTWQFHGFESVIWARRPN